MSILNKFLAMHNALAVQDHMVYEVWEDGEITLTKGGDLYGMRRLHLIKGGDVSKALPVDCFPVKFKNGHGCIQVMTSEEANEASNLILN
jgi:hypothetical protein